MWNENGILIAENGSGDYQIIGIVASVDEAGELAAAYIAHGPRDNNLAPERLVIHRRGRNGHYINVQELDQLSDGRWVLEGEQVNEA